jgi:hypothetical protein
MLIAIRDKGGENIDREEPAPKQERAFLAGPQRRKFIEGRQGTIAVRCHVGHRKIVGEEIVFERADREGDEREDGNPCIVRALSD